MSKAGKYNSLCKLHEEGLTQPSEPLGQESVLKRLPVSRQLQKPLQRDDGVQQPSSSKGVGVHCYLFDGHQLQVASHACPTLRGAPKLSLRPVFPGTWVPAYLQCPFSSRHLRTPSKLQCSIFQPSRLSRVASSCVRVPLLHPTGHDFLSRYASERSTRPILI